jgi:hypothetical protein
MARGMYVGASKKRVMLINLLPKPSEWSKYGSKLPTVSTNEEFVFPAWSGDSHFTLSMDAPIANHIYYIRCMMKAPSGSTFGDGRFEYWASDANCLILYAYHHTTGNWEMTSNTKAFTNVSGTWQIRNFIVNSSTESYRKEPMLIDLTACFGAGNEPTKEWCDANISYFLGTNYIEIDTSSPVARKVKSQYVGVGNVARNIKKSYIGVGNVARAFFPNAFPFQIYAPVNMSEYSILTIENTPTKFSVQIESLGDTSSGNIWGQVGYQINGLHEGDVVEIQY